MNAQSNTAPSATWSTLMPWVWKVPVVSERVAAQLFITPFGRLRPEEQVEPASEGAEEAVRGQRHVAVTRYGSGSPVLLVHGWGGRGLQMAGFVDPLVARGHSVLAVDLPAHGNSDGSQTNVVEAAEALLALQRRYGRPAGVIAHSFGAAATVIAQQRGLAADALVFVAPLPSLDVGMKQFAVRANLPLPVVDRATRLVEKSVGLERMAMELGQVGPKLRTPLLLVHDAQDRTISHQHSQEIAQAWPGARLLTTQGLGHRRILRDPEVLARAAAFLQQGTHVRESELARQSELECVS